MWLIAFSFLGQRAGEHVPNAESASVPPVMPPVNVLFSLLGLAVLCSSIAYLLYYRLIRDVVPTHAISVTFLVPIFGVIWGATFYGETLNGSAIVGGVTVLIGVALVPAVLPVKRKARN